MARHVGDPRIRLVVRDSAGEVAHRLRNVGDRGHLAQIFVARGEPAGEAALPPVDHRQRERPRAGRRPRRQRQRPPRQPLRDGRAPQHRGDADDDRGDGAPPDVGVPPPEDRRGAGEDLEALRRAVDQRCDDAQVQVRHHERPDHQGGPESDRDRLPATDLHARQPIADRPVPVPPSFPLLAASFPLLAASARVCSATRRCSPGFCGRSRPATVRKMPLVTATGRRRARKSSARASVKS